ncbi:MAG: hypothetical protein ACI9FJ_002097, partial [Alteromonadaceae bacterium]
GLFCQINWPVIPYPVDHWTLPSEPFMPRWNFARHFMVFNDAVKEWLGLTAYYISGKTPALLPDQCHW